MATASALLLRLHCGAASAAAAVRRLATTPAFNSSSSSSVVVGSSSSTSSASSSSGGSSSGTNDDGSSRGGGSVGGSGGRLRTLAGVPSLRDFMRATAAAAAGGNSRHHEHGSEHGSAHGSAHGSGGGACDSYVAPAGDDSGVDAALGGDAPLEAAPAGGTVYIETFGCQMNEADTEVVVAILAAAGYARVADAARADVILTNTCAVRDGAEAKVWHRLGFFKNLKRGRARGEPRPVVGVLGCMAERLKSRLVESDKEVDLVVGPDAYRDLPRLLAMVRGGAVPHAVNVQLSQDETYADVAPVRASDSAVGAYVSVMRGCNNMCSFCIVPFTRGRERSRDVGTIVDEVVRLAAGGVREVTLLGQNVNSFHDAATPAGGRYAGGGYAAAAGFGNMYKARDGDGVRFTELLDRVSAAAPEVRIRFTSPHPKDFPDALLALMAERPNICKQVHLPAQSGSTRVLAAMRRGYSRDAYLALAERIRAVVPGVALSSDFITGFCGETEEDHADTLALLRAVRYEQAYMFAYSRRDRTHAAHNYADDVPPEVKQRRLAEVIDTFRAGAASRAAADVGTLVVALTEGAARRSTPGDPTLVGRTDNNKRIVWPAAPLPDAAAPAAPPRLPRAGDYVILRVQQAGIATLRAHPLAFTSLAAAATALQQFK